MSRKLKRKHPVPTPVDLDYSPDPDFSIRFRQQIHHNSCYSTVLAMLLDLPTQTFTDAFHPLYDNWKEMGLTNPPSASNVLTAFGLRHRRLYADQSFVDADTVTLLLVPSLNIESGIHAILAGNKGMRARLFDPNRGRDNKLFYDIEAGAGAKVLGSFVPELTVDLDHLAEWHQNPERFCSTQAFAIRQTLCKGSEDAVIVTPEIFLSFLRKHNSNI